MAAPIAHIFLAVQMLAGPFSGLFNEQEFIVGTSFPDIRYLKVIERNETHFKDVKLHEIQQEKDSFKAGMLFHSFVDEQREKFMVQHKFYEKIPSFKFTTQSLKFAEDIILTQHFDVLRYQYYFDNILEVQKKYGISEQSLNDWHTFLKNYLNAAYNQKDLIKEYFNINGVDPLYFKRLYFSVIYAKQVKQTITTIINDSEMNKLITDFYLGFVEKAMKVLNE